MFSQRGGAMNKATSENQNACQYAKLRSLVAKVEDRAILLTSTRSILSSCSSRSASLIRNHFEGEGKQFGAISATD